jgi:hypothetical protein
MAEKRQKLIVIGLWPYEKRKLRPAKPIHMPRKTLIKTSIGSMGTSTACNRTHMG